MRTKLLNLWDQHFYHKPLSEIAKYIYIKEIKRNASHQLKVNNKNTKTTFMTLFLYFYERL